MVSDYNRGVHPVVRALHVAAASVGGIVRVIIDPVRIRWALPATLGVVGFLVFYPFDGAVSHVARAIRLSGDVRREVETWQQYGQFGSMVFAAIIIALLDGRRWRRLLDLAAAALCTAVVVNLMKMFVGRPRPKFDDPHTILWPTGMYPLPRGDGSYFMAHAYDLGKPISSSLWSMPSSHTAYAMVLSLFLAALYPRLRWLGWVMVAFVGVARVITGGHWPTDVIVGAAVGYLAGRPAIDGYWGVRAVDWGWRQLVDPHAAMALPGVVERDRGVAGS